jgi:hypothetical protein
MHRFADKRGLIFAMMMLSMGDFVFWCEDETLFGTPLAESSAGQ